MLEDLDVEEEENGAIASPPMEQLGARPKEFSSPSNEVPDLVMDTDDAEEISTNEEPSFDHETDLSRESPPPYSEVDPLKKSIERPNSLDLSSETTAQESLASPQENAQTNEGTAGAYTIVIHDKDLAEMLKEVDEVLTSSSEDGDN